MKISITTLVILATVAAGAVPPVHADGEILAHDVCRLEVDIVEKGISVIVP